MENRAEPDRYFWLDLAIFVFVIMPSIAVALSFERCLP